MPPYLYYLKREINHNLISQQTGKKKDTYISRPRKVNKAY